MVPKCLPVKEQCVTFYDTGGWISVTASDGHTVQ